MSSVFDILELSMNTKIKVFQYRHWIQMTGIQDRDKGLNIIGM